MIRCRARPPNTALLRVSPSIVRLTFSTGNDTCEANGTIFSSIPDDDNGTFDCYILTTVKLFNLQKRLPDEETGVSLFSKINVYLPTDKLYEGELVACDMEIKIAIIKIKSEDSLPTATLTPFTDMISVSPFGVSECYAPLHQSPYPTKLFPGDEVSVVCSKFGKSSDTVVCSGTYLVDYIGLGFDLNPFLRINCKNVIVTPLSLSLSAYISIFLLEDGAPVINCEGDVIGVAFNIFKKGVVFLPVNVFFKWWKQVLTNGEIRRPWIGIQTTNLYTIDIGDLEAIVHDCNVSEGVIVEEVCDRSPAYSANMQPGDVIYQCDGIPVRSFLEFTELLWDKSGEVIEAKGVRYGCHFVWKVEIQAIKSEILPESLSEYVFTKDIRTGILPAKNVVVEAIKEVLPESSVEDVAARKKSAKRGKDKAKDKRKSKKDREVTGLNAKTGKRERKTRAPDYDSVAAENLDGRKKRRWALSKCSQT